MYKVNFSYLLAFSRVYKRNKKSNNVLHSISTQIFQYVNSNRHQFISIQYKFFLDTRLFKKLFQREKSLSLDPFSLISMEKSLSHSYSSRLSYVLILSSGWFTVPYWNQRFYLTILYFSDSFSLSYWLFVHMLLFLKSGFLTLECIKDNRYQYTWLKLIYYSWKTLWGALFK